MPRSFWKLSCFLLLVFCFSVQIFAEDDPNPDSPTPVLLSQPGSTQVLAADDENWLILSGNPNYRAQRRCSLSHGT